MTHKIVTLKPITAITVHDITALKVTPAQANYVSPNAISLAQANFEPKAWYRAIYADDKPVGFLMMRIDPDKSHYYLWRFMIDANEQRQGYGRAAINLMRQHVENYPNAYEILLTYVPGAHSPGPFYHHCGFEETGHWHGDEKVMRLPLTANAPNRVANEEVLLAHHRTILTAHLQQDVASWLAVESDDYTAVNRGQITHPTKAERRTRRQHYLETTQFTSYQDDMTPQITVSGDGQLGWLIARVTAKGSQTTDDGHTIPIDFTAAWIELYHRENGHWRVCGNVSNMRP